MMLGREPEPPFALLSVLEFSYNKVQITIFICTKHTEIPVGNTFRNDQSN